MNLISTPVLGASALATAPMLWQGLITATMPMETVLTRFGMVMVGVWVALSALEMLIGTTGPSGSTGTALDQRPPSVDDTA